jgi:hypothetical protein
MRSRSSTRSGPQQPYPWSQNNNDITEQTLSSRHSSRIRSGWDHHALDGAVHSQLLLLVGHADDAPDARRAAIERMGTGLEHGTVEPRRFAHLVDRDAAMHGHDQHYGTLFVPVDGTPQAVWPMPPEDEIDRARQAIDLPPLRFDRQRYRDGATPGPFLIPSTRQDTAALLARLTVSYLRHGRATRRLFFIQRQGERSRGATYRRLHG